MEFLAFQRCMEFLFGKNLNMTTFITDRHMSIQKHMRKQLPEVKHYFDLWHLKKSKLMIC